MGSPSSAQRGPLPEEELFHEPEGLVSPHPGKEGSDIHSSFILSFLQPALSEPQLCAWPTPALRAMTMQSWGAGTEMPLTQLLGVVRAGFLEEVAAKSPAGE